MQRYYSQTEFVATQMVQMIQSISQNRASKAITPNDLKYIHCAAWLSVYPGTTMYLKNNKGYDFAHMPRSQIFYVKGVGNGKVSCLWRAYIIMTSSSGDVPNTVFYDTAKNQDDSAAWITQYKKNVVPSQINSKLPVIPQGETRIIVEVAITRRDGKDPSGKIIPLRESLVFYLLTPKTKLSQQQNAASIANSCVVFSPNPNLFTDEPPQ